MVGRIVGGARRRALLGAVIAIAIVAAVTVTPAAAQRATGAAGATAEAERAYRKGYEALQAGDCAAALVHYRRSFALAPRPRTLFNMAACEEELGLGADAWRSYHAFLGLAEPRDAEIVVKARARIVALRGALRGRITVESSPPGAAVVVDGERQPRGVTPLTLSLEPGAHTLRLTLTGAAPTERTVEIVPDEHEAVAVTLAAAATVAITIVAEPPDATIARVTGRGGATGPGLGAAATIGRHDTAVAPGRHVFEVRRDGYLTERVEIDAVAGRGHVERVRLRPLPPRSTLVVAGRPHEVAPGEVLTVDLAAPRGDGRRRALGWGLGGLGVAGLGGGAVLGVMALRDVTGPPGDDHDRGKRRALAADGLIVVGAAAVVGAWWLLRARSPAVAVSRRPEEGR
ncbi:MAG: PEGA domain-containing protein [Myxococcales bacterium]|nr:PEGA domain-containing protein [Myxococcales bacterium]